MPRKASGTPKISVIKRKRKNGDIYVYEVTTLYNPAKRYNEHVSSKLIGKITPGSNEITSTRPKISNSKTVRTATRKNVGTMDILDWIGKASGIDDDIFNSTDEGTAKKIISLARYWMANPDKSIRRIEEWQLSHVLPYSDGISEGVCYSLMKDIGNNADIQQHYFHQRAAKVSSKKSVAVDSTTISSYSEHLNDVRFGYNKDGNGLASVKLLTLFGTEDHQPIAYAKQPGNIPDVTSVLNTLKQLSVLGMDKPLLVLDGGFFSESNILGFIHAHCKFLVRGQLDGRWILPELEKIVADMETPSNAHPHYQDIYCQSVKCSHQFSYERKRYRSGVQKGAMVSEEHRIYLHFYLDVNRARIDKAALMNEIHNVRSQLINGVNVSLLSRAEQRIADKFMRIRHKQNGTVTITLNDAAIIKESRYYGYFVLVSNDAIDAFHALREYRLRERTEEGFRIDKQYNDAHITRSKSTASLEGRFFCQFVAFGYESFFLHRLSQLKKSLAVPNGDPKHDKSDMFKNEKKLLNWLNGMSVAKLFDWFDAVQETTVETPMGKSRWRTETTERDKLFLQRLGVIKE